MCLRLTDENPLIIVGEKTNKSKYDFLRGFYPSWNKIVKTRERVIIDTHAGTGMVELQSSKDILGVQSKRKMYGSPLLAIIKTLTISNRLTIILNEANLDIFSTLKSHLDTFVQEGVPVFRKIESDFKYRSLETKRQRRQKKKAKYTFPDFPDCKPESGYETYYLFTKANVQCINNKI